MSFPFLHRLRKDTRGILAVEFALALPVLVLIAIAGIEMTRLILINQKVDRATSTMADLVSQSRELVEADLTAMFSASQYVMEPYTLDTDGVVIVSSISASGGAQPVVNWQRTFGAGTGTSNYGAEGGTATLPTGFLVRDDESIIVSETFFDYKPMLVNNVLSARPLYSSVVYRPRFSPLTTLLP